MSHDGVIARLIYINGLPGIGKTSLAIRYGTDHPLTLVVDIDLIRTQLGGWETRGESKLMARDLAVALVESHLMSGHDVVVPQYLAKMHFIERLERAAISSNASFVEVIVVADLSVALTRFVDRRTRLRITGEVHPEADIHDRDLQATFETAETALAELCVLRPSIRPVSKASGAGDSYAELLRAIGA